MAQDAQGAAPGASEEVSGPAPVENAEAAPGASLGQTAEPAKRGQRLVVQPVKEGPPDGEFRTWKKDGPPIEIEETPALAEARRTIRAGGWVVLGAEAPDQGSGFYRFAVKDLPGLPSRSMMAGNAIECFGTDLANARRHLQFVVGQARKVKPDQVDVSAVHPIAHRPTRLCKRARKARGQA